MIEKVNYLDFKMRFSLERHADFSSFYQVFIENFYPHLLNSIRKGDVVIDAGGKHRGIHSDSFFLGWRYWKGDCRRTRSGKCRLPEKNISINGLKNVTVVDKALFIESDRTIDLNSNGTMSHIITEQSADFVSNLNRYAVKTITFDDLMTGLEITPSALKMDIEGAEKFALRSAVKTLESIRLLEAQIHDVNSESELLKHEEFHFEISSAENRNNVRKFALRHPFIVFILEYNNKFQTAKRLLADRSLMRESYPKILFGVNHKVS